MAIILTSLLWNYVFCPDISFDLRFYSLLIWIIASFLSYDYNWINSEDSPVFFLYFLYFVITKIIISFTSTSERALSHSCPSTKWVFFFTVIWESCLLILFHKPFKFLISSLPWNIYQMSLTVSLCLIWEAKKESTILRII